MSFDQSTAVCANASATAQNTAAVNHVPNGTFR